MTRSVPEWIGASPDTPAPPRVRLRVLERHNYTCFWSKQPIKPGDKWECDHAQALINGGANRESNLVPALKREHQIKTRKDVFEKTKRAKALKKSYGLNRPKPRRKMNGTVVWE